MPKTVIGYVDVPQVCWEAVPNRWPGNSKASIASIYWVVCVEQQRAGSVEWYDSVGHHIFVTTTIQGWF